MTFRPFAILAFALAGLGLLTHPAIAKNYGPGVSDHEIKIGQTMPYSGPASAYGVIGKAEAAYFKMINDEGGVNGRTIDLISLDDGYSPPKTVEQTRKLVEQDRVLFVYGGLGTPTNTAVHRYFNAKHVPQLFVATGASKWGQPKKFPWTMGWQPNYHTEGRIYGEYIREHIPDAKIGILYQNDDYGKDYVNGLKEGLGDMAKKMIVAEVTYEVTDPTVDSQIISLKGSGANVFFNVTTPKFAAQAIRKAYDIDWHPTQFLNNVSASIGSVLKPAGLDKAKGVITANYLKDPTDKRWKDDKGYQKWEAWREKYMPNSDPSDINIVYGYSSAQTLVHVLKAAGDDLTRANIMKQAANLHDLHLDMLLPGVTVATGPDDYYPIEKEQLYRFDGKNWVPLGKMQTD